MGLGGIFVILSLGLCPGVRQAAPPSICRVTGVGADDLVNDRFAGRVSEGLRNLQGVPCGEQSFGQLPRRVPCATPVR